MSQIEPIVIFTLSFHIHDFINHLYKIYLESYIEFYLFIVGALKITT